MHSLGQTMECVYSIGQVIECFDPLNVYILLGKLLNVYIQWLSCGMYRFNGFNQLMYIALN